MQICSLLSCDLWKSLGRCYSEKWMDGQTARQQRIEQDWAMTLASPFSLQVEECVCWANCSWKIELSFHSEHPRLADHTHTHTAANTLTSFLNSNCTERWLHGTYRTVTQSHKALCSNKETCINICIGYVVEGTIDVTLSTYLSDVGEVKKEENRRWVSRQC